MRSCSISTTLFSMLMLVTILKSSGFAQTQESDFFVRPIVGSRMIVGDGPVAEYTRACFLHLCNEPLPKIVVIGNGPLRVPKTDWIKRGAGSVVVVETIPDDTTALTLELLDASGVWVEGNSDAIAESPLLVALLKNVTRRNGVVALGSSSVALLSQLDENDKAKRLQSPFAKCEFHFGNGVPSGNRKGESSQSKAHWVIPQSTVMVVHQGRQIAGYGAKDLSVEVSKVNGWPERRDSFECPDVFSRDSHPFYGIDLLAWVRSANDRRRPVFPPKVANVPELESGTLFLHGGSRVSEEVMREFVKLAGGQEASIVCIPSAGRFEWPDQPDSHSASVLHEIGHSKYSTLHTEDPLRADQSREFADLLENADAVWIDGGRTYRFMDCYEGTNVEKLIAQVLKRGGVVGGSSAGCQVPSEFLVRGNPQTNRDIVFGGYTRGMGLLKGVIIDAHFLQRGRHEPFVELMRHHPQMLGIGIDEKTALIVRGEKGTVLGEASVSFYDLTQKSVEFKPTILNAGQTYNLKLRKAER